MSRVCRAAAVGVVAVAAALAALAPLHVRASVGTGVQAGAIVLPDTAEPGHSYELPRLYIVNTGTEASRYAVHVQRLTHGAEHDVPMAWISLGTTDISLAPGRSLTVPVRLRVPTDAASGDYLTNLVVGTTTPGTTSGAALGAAAAAELRFSVVPGGRHLPWPWPWWAYTVVFGAALIVIAALLQRRLGVRLSVHVRREEGRS